MTASPTKVLMAWSSGKDSAMTLHTLLGDSRFQVHALLSTVTEDYGRVSMHGVRECLLEQQAEAFGLPLVKVKIPAGSSNETYEDRMRAALDQARQCGVEGVAFGDIFLEDLRKYREDKLAQAGMKGVFPLWKRDTHRMAREFIELGFRTILTCVDTQVLDAKFAGREFDHQLLADLPPHIDPCGENGEFHTFCYDGPIFQRPIQVDRGEVVLRENRFSFCDLLPPVV